MADGKYLTEVNQMPGMDGTGPAGQGPMTGRGQGPCNPLGTNSSQATPQQPISWLGKILQGTLGSFGLGAYGIRRGGGRGMGGGRRQGRGRRRTF
ncbi:MAG: DUF5320 domain-containing protein [Armatimonadota bacterium]|nr:DUF5320 domain-containing protein [Armatimonadota bacterium]